MSSIEIDPTFVLKYLNDLGYRNITAEQLKEFIRDLKKLIKYDKSKEESQHYKENVEKHFVYMKETESSRAKRSHSTKSETGNASCAPAGVTSRSNSQTCTSWRPQDGSKSRPNSQITTALRPMEGRKLRTNTRVSEYSKSTSALDNIENYDTNRTSGEATLRENVDHMNHVPRSRTRVSGSKDVMWIRPKSGSRAKKSDPVSMFQAYQQDWNRFKNQIPIDNKHQNLRWNIRKKTMG